jgi:MFS family permease
LSFPREFGIAGETGRDPWLVGIVNAAPYIAASLVGCWMSDPLNNWLGRRGTIFLTALCLVATPIASGFAKSWEGLFAARLVLGLGMGCKGSTVPVFAAENSPTAIRGALVMSWQLWTVSSAQQEIRRHLIFFRHLVSSSASLQTWSSLILGQSHGGCKSVLPLFLLCPSLSACTSALYVWKLAKEQHLLITASLQESPRWLMKKNRYPQAYRSLLRLRFTPLQAARDLYYIHAQLEAESLIMRGETYIGRFKELFVIPRVRRATLASFTVMIAQQMCGKSRRPAMALVQADDAGSSGINIIAFYSSTIFVISGYTPREALYASVGFGAIK